MLSRQRHVCAVDREKEVSQWKAHSSRRAG